mmetsp:Transcript_8699/g.11465  ORF Transcript_8699/g.11465 Transcript_8699/m.11465 type:complete len:272 (+) Transcript_8699:188-1003(+)
MAGEDMLNQMMNDANDEAALDASLFLASAGKEMDTQFVAQAVVPGDDVTAAVTRRSRKIRLGDGLLQQGQKVVSSRAGSLRYRPPNIYWVDSNHKRYIPKAEDRVIGIIEARSGDYYRVNIFGSSSALLPILAFEGATKKHKPNLKAGALVYCRVLISNRDMEPELTCNSSQGGVKKDWMTGQSTFGELKDGMMLRINLGLAQALLQPNCAVLNLLGRHLPFEIAIGMNGGIWVNSGSPVHTIVICNAILNSEGMTDDEKEAMVERLISTL